MGEVLSILKPLVVAALALLFNFEPREVVRLSQALVEETGKSKPQLRMEARDELGIDPDRYNVVFGGGSGTGKSSLLNSILGFDPDDPGGAAVGETETTRRVTAYNSTDVKYLTMWDTPGGGTVRHPGREYFVDKKLYAFDFIIVVVANRFRELDLAIVEAARHFDVPVAIIRSKSDMDIDARYRRLRRRLPDLQVGDVRDALKRETLAKIRRQLCASDLIDVPVFYISSFVLDGSLDKADYGMDEDDVVGFVTDTISQRRKASSSSEEEDSSSSSSSKY